jgi:putative PIN family toxin of toxin-antitoxin system
MRVVIDTNVFVSSFFGGKPRQIIDLWKKGEITICLSPDIIEEYVEVLRRLGLEDEPEIGEFIDLFAKKHRLLFATKTPSLRIVREDPADDKFIECAVALKARVIITGDKRLKAIGHYTGIKILSPGKWPQETGLPGGFDRVSLQAKKGPCPIRNRAHS